MASGEYIFLLDRSGSMSGNRIEKAKTALISCLNTMPKNSFFNVVSYGTNFTYFSNESLRNTNENIQNAIDDI